MLCGWILFYLLASRAIGYRLDKKMYEKYAERMDYFKQLIADDLKDAKDFRKVGAILQAFLALRKLEFCSLAICCKHRLTQRDQRRLSDNHARKHGTAA